MTDTLIASPLAYRLKLYTKESHTADLRVLFVINGFLLSRLFHCVVEIKLVTNLGCWRWVLRSTVRHIKLLQE